MPFEPRFNYTHSIVRYLQTIEGARAVVGVLPVLPDRDLALRQAARQRATANSTAIEGNNLGSAALTRAIAKGDRTANNQEQEVRNYWRALEWIEEQVENHAEISLDFICELHRIIVIRGRGRRGVRSEWRRGPCPVVNTVTQVLEYAPPRESEVPILMRELTEWLASSAVRELPAPLRAAILAHRFVSIHPFDDGNGRTTRALATAELWRSGYDLRGFLSIEEHFAADRDSYYRNLQLGQPVDFYEGRNAPDHTPWIEYMLRLMSIAAEAVRDQAEVFYRATHPQAPIWTNLPRRKQQLLMRLLTRGLAEPSNALEFNAADLQEWYGISDTTAHDWMTEWRLASFIEPVLTARAVRIRRWTLGSTWRDVVENSLNFAREQRMTIKPTNKPGKNV